MSDQMKCDNMNYFLWVKLSAYRQDGLVVYSLDDPCVMLSYDIISVVPPIYTTCVDLCMIVNSKPYKTPKYYKCSIV